MIYRCLQPGVQLRNFVKDYLVIHFSFPSATKVPFKPYPACPKQGLIFYIKGFATSIDVESGKAHKRASVVIFGQPIKRQNLYLSAEYMAISVRFVPGALYKFLGIPMTQLLQANEDAELILGNEIRSLLEQLRECPSVETMIGLIESFLIRRINNLKDTELPVDRIAKFIYDTPDEFILDSIAKRACLSVSQLERRFLDQVGIPPKFYARICRFYKAYLAKQRNPNLSWLEVAWDYGYGDYQHMVKDFKAFAHNTPPQLVQEDAYAPEQSLALNPGFKYD